MAPAMAQALGGVLRDELLHVVDLERLKRKELLAPAEVEALYGLKVATLETWRCRGGGPDFIKLGGKLVYYRPEDIKQYLNAGRVKGRV